MEAYTTWQQLRLTIPLINHHGPGRRRRIAASSEQLSVAVAAEQSIPPARFDGYEEAASIIIRAAKGCASHAEICRFGGSSRVSSRLPTCRPAEHLLLRPG